MYSSRRSFLSLATGALGGLLNQQAYGVKASPAAHNETISTDVPETLRGCAAQSNLLIGNAVVSVALQGDPAYRTLVGQQSSILVADWEMKWNALRPAPDQFYFVAADWLLAFAAQNNQRLRGHNLCWDQALPAWFASFATTKNARSLLSQHIRTVIGRYAGKMHSWDVVNEPINVSDGRPDGLRASPWLNLCGSDYIDYAFRTARLADPNALLTINESGIELDTTDNAAKRGYLLQLVRGMKARGVPIDAVGIESHLMGGASPAGSGLLAFVRELAALGVQVFLTELDVNDVNIAGSIAQRDAAVATTYAGYLNLLLPEPNVTALLTWELRDPDSWLQGLYPRSDGSPLRPLPFDVSGQPKLAFGSICQSLNARTAALRPGFAVGDL